jgi:hypothetical protein
MDKASMVRNAGRELLETEVGQVGAKLLESISHDTIAAARQGANALMKEVGIAAKAGAENNTPLDTISIPSLTKSISTLNSMLDAGWQAKKISAEDLLAATVIRMQSPMHPSPEYVKEFRAIGDFEAQAAKLKPGSDIESAAISFRETGSVRSHDTVKSMIDAGWEPKDISLGSMRTAELINVSKGPAPTPDYISTLAKHDDFHSLMQDKVNSATIAKRLTGNAADTHVVDSMIASGWHPSALTRQNLYTAASILDDGGAFPRPSYLRALAPHPQFLPGRITD